MLDSKTSFAKTTELWLVKKKITSPVRDNPLVGYLPPYITHTDMPSVVLEIISQSHRLSQVRWKLHAWAFLLNRLFFTPAHHQTQSWLYRRFFSVPNSKQTSSCLYAPCADLRDRKQVIYSSSYYFVSHTYWLLLSDVILCFRRKVWFYIIAQARKPQKPAPPPISNPSYWQPFPVLHERKYYIL